MQTTCVTPGQTRALDWGAMAANPDHRSIISSGPLFARLRKKPGAASKFARDLGISEQRLTNWKRRGLPPAALPGVAAALGLTVEAYLKEAGHDLHVARSPVADYLTDDERELLDLYRAATGRWRLAIKHMAALRGDHVQDEAAESMNAVFAKIAAEPVDDGRVAAAYGLPPKESRRK